MDKNETIEKIKAAKLKIKKLDNEMQAIYDDLLSSIRIPNKKSKFSFTDLLFDYVFNDVDCYLYDMEAQLDKNNG